MSNSPHNETPMEYAIRMLENGQTKQQVENELVQQGNDRRFAAELVAEVAKMRDARNRSRGLTLILAGAVICFASFLLTITGMVSGDAYTYVLFGLTSLGVVVAFAGFTMVF